LLLSNQQEEIIRGDFNHEMRNLLLKQISRRKIGHLGKKEAKIS
jgi:hypothetical protein